MSAFTPSLRTPNPMLMALIEHARTHRMTKAERDAQRRSYVRGELMLAHPEMSKIEADAIIDRVEGQS